MLNIAILGASGAVGQEILKTLEQRQFPIGTLKLLASPRSAGKKYPFRGRLVPVEAVTPESFKGVHIGLFSAGGSVSAEWAPVAAAAGAVVVDNTSHFRMMDDVPLVVPEVNGDLLTVRPPKGIIANPNCSTIQMVHALDPLHREYGIRRIVVSTYQSASGKGASAMEEMTVQTRDVLDGKPAEVKVFQHAIAFNLIPHIDSFTPNGYTKEELKMVNETRKIMRAPNVLVSATCVRVPVYRCHSEAVNVEFEKPVDLARVRQLLAAQPNVVVVDEPSHNEYPMPVYATGRDETFVGRLRLDVSNPKGTGLDMWIVSDNLRKGAALNAVQIAEVLVKNRVVG